MGSKIMTTSTNGAKPIKSAEEWLEKDKHLDSLDYEYEELLVMIRAIQDDCLASVATQPSSAEVPYSIDLMNRFAAWAMKQTPEVIEACMAKKEPTLSSDDEKLVRQALVFSRNMTFNELGQDGIEAFNRLMEKLNGKA